MLAALLQESQLEPEFVLDVSFLTPLVALFIPILVGLLTKSTASSGTKAVLNMGLAALSGFITAVIANNGAFTLKEAFNGIVIAWVTSWASYSGFLKPAGITAKVQNATPELGIG